MIWVLLSTGCGVTGGTYARAVPLSPALRNVQTRSNVAVGTVLTSPGAVRHKAIGAFSFGRFDDADRETLRRSLELSLAVPSRAEHEVHVRIRYFASTATNNRIAALAAVDWCVAKGSELLASERFWSAYDTGDRFMNTETLGMAKGHVLDAITQRVAERALAAANGLATPAAPKHTHDDAAAALRGLPDIMVAEANGLLAAGLQLALGGGAGTSDLKPEEALPPTDWKTELQPAGP